MTDQPFIVMEQTSVISVHKGDVNCIASGPGVIASCSGDKTVRVFNTDSFQEVSYSPLSFHKYHVISCTITSDGHRLCSTSMDGKASIVDIRSGKLLSMISHPCEKGMRASRFASPRDHLLALGAVDGSICLIETEHYTLIRLFDMGDSESIASLAFTADSNWLVSGSSVGDVRIWNASFPSNYCTTTLPAVHDCGVLACDMTQCAVQVKNITSSLFITAGGDSAMKLWRIVMSERDEPTLSLVDTMLGHTSAVYSCKFSANGALVISGSADFDIRLWDVMTGQCLHTQIGSHTKFVNSVIFSADMKFVCSGSTDKLIKIWKITNTAHLVDVSAQDFEKSQLSRGCLLSGLDSASNAGSEILSWNVDDVCGWLTTINMGKYSQVFKANDIDGEELVQLSEQILEQDLKIDSFGARKKIIRGLQELQNQTSLNGSLSSQSHEPLAAVDVPNEYLCPITHELMKEPMQAADGYTYEQRAIQAWLDSGKSSSPMTNAPLDSNSLVPNRTLKILIAQYRSAKTAAQ